MKPEIIALDEVCRFSDQELIARLMHLNRSDQTLNARLIVHLGEVDARGLYREHACSSMFAYCVEELHMSEAQAYLRIQAARLGRQFPLILHTLAQGAVNLTTIKLLGPHLTEDNHVRLLEQASGKGKRDIELLVAAMNPKPDVPNRIRKLPEPKQAPLAVTQAPEASAGREPFALETPSCPSSSKPLRPGRYKVELTVGQALYDKLEQLKQLLRHQVPDGDLSAIFERAVDVLLEQTLKRRCARSSKPKKPRAVARKRSRYIPRAVVRDVHERDAGQCTFVSREGKRCRERGFLELHHHDVPFARGGEHTPQNLRLVCRAHNALLAERDYGRDFIRAKSWRKPSDSFQERVHECR